MKIINLIGGPNTGKTTTALGLTYLMKMAGYRVKYVSEYAEEMVYEERSNILEDQLYILAKQNRRLHRLRGLVDYVVTDSPLVLGLVYAKDGGSPELRSLIHNYWNQYDNATFMLGRNSQMKFETQGRVQQSHTECLGIDDRIRKNLPSGTIELDLASGNIDQIAAHLGLWHVERSRITPPSGIAKTQSREGPDPNPVQRGGMPQGIPYTEEEQQQFLQDRIEDVRARRVLWAEGGSRESLYTLTFPFQREMATITVGKTPLPINLWLWRIETPTGQATYTTNQERIGNLVSDIGRGPQSKPKRRARENTSTDPVDRRYLGTIQDRALHGDDLYDRPA